MEPIYRIGDKVEFIVEGKYKGMKGIISEIRDNPDTFEKDYVYFLEGFKGYSYHYHLKLDLEYLREEKINKILKSF